MKSAVLKTIVLLLAFAGENSFSSTSKVVSNDDHVVRMAWWREARFGMFSITVQ